ncbi:FRG domain-containing protein [Algoriphagus aestuariicola]|uniref:FRG domain-containing protein n=1 Tax=Algoriphagus aestuariicola TaxID=1852016 RepID=A0ABS3BLU2_9BACT|nr:FRG domain-containing protein [Algoriphagus aestuariicola]MBN7800138.1 FRG domain-containing protein [Algoriphagus aestuariicola]
MHSLTFKNWDDFKSNMIKKLLISSGKSSINSFLFRGQADSKWDLISSFDRKEKNKSKYDLLLRNFESICKIYNFNEELFSKSRNEPELIAAYAQHYGLPTRLLDWTTSPYFAAFFAFSDAYSLNIKSKSCVVWVINRDSVSLNTAQGLKFVSLSTNKYNYRIKNQLGHFTLSQHSESSIDEFDKMLCFKYQSDDLLWKMEINYSSIEEVLADLEIMGITPSIAYPDIEGYIKEAIYKTGIGVYL